MKESFADALDWPAEGRLAETDLQNAVETYVSENRDV